MTERACASCRATDLESGVLLDIVQGGAVEARYMPGEPEFGAFGGLKYRNNSQFSLKAHRCRQCSYLNLFVGEPA